MIERPPLRAIVGAALLAALAYLLLNAPLRPLAWAGWLLGFLLFAALLALLGRPRGTRPSAEWGTEREHLVELVCRARGIDAAEAERLVEAAWRGDAAVLAAARIMLRPGLDGEAALEALERRFSREVRFVDAELWEPGSASPYTARATHSAHPARGSAASDPSIPPGLEALFVGTRRDPSRPRPTRGSADPEAVGQTSLEWDSTFDPADGDPPPGEPRQSAFGASSSAGEGEATVGSLADFADDPLDPFPSEPVRPAADAAPLSDIDPYAEEWDGPATDPLAPLPNEGGDDDDPFAALLPDDPFSDQDGEADDDPWSDAPPTRRPNPFAPDEPFADPHARGGAFRAPLREERPKR